MSEDPESPAPRMMRTGEFEEVEWSTARRLGLTEWAPEQEVRDVSEQDVPEAERAGPRRRSKAA